MRAVAVCLCCWVLALGCRKESVQKNMAFELGKYTTADSAKLAIEKELPEGTSRDKVQAFLRESRIKCFDNEAETLSCRVIEDSSTMVHAVWQLAFYFDSQRRLSRVVVTRGLVGP
jgi:hypothetical protein